MDKEQPIYICNPDNSSFVKRLFKAQQQNAEFIDIYSRVFWLDKQEITKKSRD
jgi:hypothetical protein